MVGFSLLETLIAVVLMALVGATVLRPNLRGADMPMAARQVAVSLQHARLAAMRLKKPSSVMFDVNRRLIRSDVGGMTTELPSGVSLSLLTSEDQVTSAQTGMITFFGDGSSTGGTVVMRQDNRSIRIGVSWLTGVAVVED